MLSHHSQPSPSFAVTAGELNTHCHDHLFTEIDRLHLSLQPPVDLVCTAESSILLCQCHARDNQSHPRPKFLPSRLVPPPRVHYRSPRSLARHYYATHMSYHTTSRPHNPTPQDLARTQPHASNLAISPARPGSRRSTRLLEISLSPYYCLFAIFSSFPFMYIIVLVSAVPLSRSHVVP